LALLLIPALLSRLLHVAFMNAPFGAFHAVCGF